MAEDALDMRRCVLQTKLYYTVLYRIVLVSHVVQLTGDLVPSFRLGNSGSLQYKSPLDQVHYLENPDRGPPSAVPNNVAAVLD